MNIITVEEGELLREWAPDEGHVRRTLPVWPAPAGTSTVWQQEEPQ